MSPPGQKVRKLKVLLPTHKTPFKTNKVIVDEVVISLSEQLDRIQMDHQQKIREVEGRLNQDISNLKERLARRLKEEMAESIELAYKNTVQSVNKSIDQAFGTNGVEQIKAGPGYSSSKQETHISPCSGDNDVSERREATKKDQLPSEVGSDESEDEPENTERSGNRGGQLHQLPDQRTQFQRKKKTRDPNKPKRGLSAYMFFANEQRDTVREEDPGINSGQVGKILGEKWKALGDKQRQLYEAKAIADNERYQKEKAKYAANEQEEDEE